MFGRSGVGRWKEGHAKDLIPLCLARDDSPQHGRANIQCVGSNTHMHTHIRVSQHWQVRQMWDNARAHKRAWHFCRHVWHVSQNNSSQDGQLLWLMLQIITIAYSVWCMRFCVRSSAEIRGSTRVVRQTEVRWPSVILGVGIKKRERLILIILGIERCNYIMSHRIGYFLIPCLTFPLPTVMV